MPTKKRRGRTPYSEAKLDQHLKRELRRAFRNSPLKVEAYRLGRVAPGLYGCYVCLGRAFKRDEVEVDHVSPVVDVETGFVDRFVYFSRMFCPLENLKTICKVCHPTKSKAENARRREVKKAAKK